MNKVVLQSQTKRTNISKSILSLLPSGFIIIFLCSQPPVYQTIWCFLRPAVEYFSTAPQPLRRDGALGSYVISIYDYVSVSEEEKQIWGSKIYEHAWYVNDIRDGDVGRFCFLLRNREYEDAEDILVNNPKVVNASLPSGMRLLHWSIFCGPDTFEFLLRHGADPDFMIENLYGVVGRKKKEVDDVVLINKSFVSLLRYYTEIEGECDSDSHYFHELLSLAEEYSNENKGNSDSVKSL